MQVVLQVYIICCAMLVLFDILFVCAKNFRNLRFYPEFNKLQEEIQEQFEKYTPEEGLPGNWVQDLGVKIQRVRNLTALHNAIHNATHHQQDIMEQMKPLIVGQLEHYLKRPPAEQAYYAYVVSELDYSRKPVDWDFAVKFMELLNNKSLYTFANAMNAFYCFGNSSFMMMAIDKCNEYGMFYHKKLLVDGLMSYTGDKEELDELLKKSFEKYQNTMKESLLDYFRMSGTDASDLCLHIMRTQEIDDDVMYSAMRYFVRFPKEVARDEFLKILRREDSYWVKRLLAIQALEGYHDLETRREIKKCVTSPDWYLRTESLKYLHDTGTTREEIRELLELRDTYANDALVYQYKDDPDMTAFVEETILQIRETDMQMQEAAKAQEPEHVVMPT